MKKLALLMSLIMAGSLLTACGAASSSASAAKASSSTGAASSASSAASAKAERAKITIAYHPHITGVGGILQAQKKGYFEAENLDVQLVQFTSGATELAAMASGDIDVGYLGVGAHVFAPQGQCVVLALDSTDVSGEILTRADSGIKTMKDLKGKQVAISSGTTSELVLAMALKLNDMSRDDVTMVNMDAAAKVTAFLNGQIAAISIESPYTDQIRAKLGKENVLTLSGSADFLPDAVFTNSWVTTNKFLSAHPDLVERFMRAWLKGTQDRYDDIDGTVKMVSELIDTDYDTAHLVAEKTHYLSTSEMRKLAQEGTTLQWYDTMLQMFVDAQLLDKKYDLPSKDWVNLSYMLKAMDDLGIK